MILRMSNIEVNSSDNNEMWNADSFVSIGWSLENHRERSTTDLYTVVYHAY